MRKQTTTERCVTCELFGRFDAEFSGGSSD
jgi:hypothetical protein